MPLIPMKHISKNLFLAGAVTLVTSFSHAATISTAGVTVTETFGSAPAAADWLSAGMGGNSNAAVTTAIQMDAAVNSGLNDTDPDALPFSSTLASGTGANQLGALATVASYGTGVNARWNSTTGAIFTQPTNNYYQALLATVTNSTGGTLNSLSLTYDLYNVSNTADENHVNGHRVYFSTTGAAGSWVNLSDFNGIDDTTANLTTTINGLNWASGTSVYVMWADDNASSADATLALDNVRWTAVPEPSVALLGGLGVLGLLRRRRA